LYRTQQKFKSLLELKVKTELEKVQNANLPASVKINDVFFSDGEDDIVIDLVERELKLKRDSLTDVNSESLSSVESGK